MKSFKTMIFFYGFILTLIAKLTTNDWFWSALIAINCHNFIYYKENFLISNIGQEKTIDSSTQYKFY